LTLPRSVKGKAKKPRRMRWEKPGAAREKTWEGTRRLDPLRGFTWVDPSGERAVTRLEAVGAYGRTKTGRRPLLGPPARLSRALSQEVRHRVYAHFGPFLRHPGRGRAKHDKGRDPSERCS
jgi:hypothetical protein